MQDFMCLYPSQLCLLKRPRSNDTPSLFNGGDSKGVFCFGPAGRLLCHIPKPSRHRPLSFICLQPENAELLQSLRKQETACQLGYYCTAHQRVGNKTPTGRTRKGGDPKGGAGAEAGLAP